MSLDGGSTDNFISWIDWFIRQPHNALFCKIDSSYINDAFNLFGLRHEVPGFSRCFHTVTGLANDYMDLSEDELLENSEYEKCRHLYGMVHARYILTTKGLDRMKRKFLRGEFGTCPRYTCYKENLIACGIYPQPYTADVVGFCSKCEGIYRLDETMDCELVDGSYFGPTFPHLFFLQYTDLVAELPKAKYVPRVYGFKIHRLSPGTHHGQKRIKILSNEVKSGKVCPPKVEQETKRRVFIRAPQENGEPSASTQKRKAKKRKTT